MNKILVAAIFILAPTVFIHDSPVHALEGQIGIYDPSTIIFCDGKYYTYGTGGTSLVSAIVNGGGATDFCARLLDADDKPIKDITVSLGEVKAMPADAKTRRQTQASRHAGARGRTLRQN